ncbi:PLD nuclease N-terminal domain-containing protein [Actinokineospora inagensis]|uniref:PLD nuclease N-terminal domain-containing protein n=1 Tax=Actinokineospora inagensis TaxID=103730 RepID=UPI00047C4F79|nr:PLD nuclease N-terminal domain-containing protein [Actinokineospora inagensis]
MLYFGGAFGLLLLGLWIFCLVDVITTPEGATRNLPKSGWLLIVLLLADIGSLLWLVAGRPQQPGGYRPGAHERSAPRFPEYDRPGRFAATDAESDEEFLRRCRERAEEQRRKARENKQEF